MITIRGRIYPKWLLIVLVMLFSLITLYVPTKVFFGNLKVVQSGPYSILWDIPERVYLLNGVYYDERPMDYDFVFNKKPYDSVDTRLVAGIDYGRMGIQYLVFFIGSAIALLFLSKKETFHNQSTANKEDLIKSLIPISHAISSDFEQNNEEYRPCGDILFTINKKEHPVISILDEFMVSPNNKEQIITFTILSQHKLVSAIEKKIPDGYEYLHYLNRWDITNMESGTYLYAILAGEQQIAQYSFQVD